MTSYGFELQFNENTPMLCPGCTIAHFVESDEVFQEDTGGTSVVFSFQNSKFLEMAVSLCSLIVIFENVYCKTKGKSEMHDSCTYMFCSVNIILFFFFRSFRARSKTAILSLLPPATAPTPLLQTL